MHVNKIIFTIEELERDESDYDEYTITYTASVDGIVVNQVSLCDDKEITFTVPLIDVSRGVLESDIITHHVNMLLGVYGFTKLSLEVVCDKIGNIIPQKRWDFDDLKNRHKEYFEELDTIDPKIDLAEHHFCIVVKPILNQLYKTSTKMAKEQKIKGMDCPILKEPLKANCVFLTKCEHYVSKEAWQRINWKREGGDTETYKPCPLCRCKYEHPHEWE